MITDDEIVSKFLNIRTSAKEREIPFNLSLKKIRQLLESKICFFTGVALDKENRSFDRMDNLKGYVDSNVVACTTNINRIKRNLTLEEIEILYNGITKHQKTLAQKLKSQKEVWVPIKELNEKYEISNLGKIKNLKGDLIKIENGQFRVTLNGKRLRIIIKDIQKSYFINQEEIVVKSFNLNATRKSVTGIGLTNNSTKEQWLLHNELEQTYLAYPVTKGVVNLKVLERVKKNKDIEVQANVVFYKK